MTPALFRLSNFLPLFVKAISHNPHKKEAAQKLGATHYLDTSDKQQLAAASRSYVLLPVVVFVAFLVWFFFCFFFYSRVRVRRLLCSLSYTNVDVKKVSVLVVCCVVPMYLSFLGTDWTSS